MCEFVYELEDFNIAWKIKLMLLLIISLKQKVNPKLLDVSPLLRYIKLCSHFVSISILENMKKLSLKSGEMSHCFLRS